MRLRAKTDNNHKRIMATLRKAGCLVLSLAAMGRGVPDLLVYCPMTGIMKLVEVKNGEWRGELTEQQKAFIAQGWPVAVVYHEMEALHAMGLRAG